MIKFLRKIVKCLPNNRMITIAWSWLNSHLVALLYL